MIIVSLQDGKTIITQKVTLVLLNVMGKNISKLEFGMYPQSMPTEWTHARTLGRWQSVRLDL